MKDLSAKEYLLIGFQLGKRDYWKVFFTFLIYLALSALAAYSIVGILVLPALTVGFIRFLLKAARGEEPSVVDCLSEGFKPEIWGKACLAFLLVCLGIAAGAVLLVVPGIYLSIAWYFVFYLVADKGMSPREALDESRSRVHQLGFWKLYSTLMLMASVFFIPSFIIVYVGAWFSVPPLLTYSLPAFFMPFMVMTQTVIYENAMGNPLNPDISNSLNLNDVAQSALRSSSPSP